MPRGREPARPIRGRTGSADGPRIATTWAGNRPRLHAAACRAVVTPGWP